MKLLQTQNNHNDTEQNILENYERNHNDDDVIRSVNLLSMKILTTKNGEEIRKSRFKSLTY